mgnify:FL=1
MPNKILALDTLISKYTSYITILLFVITFLTWFPLLNLNSLLISLNLSSYNFVKWLVLNENNIFIFFLFCCAIETTILLLEIIAIYRHSSYVSPMRKILTSIVTFNIWFLLSLQTASNLGIIEINLPYMVNSVFYSQNIFLTIYIFAAIGFNIYISLNLLAGFFVSPNSIS